MKRGRASKAKALETLWQLQREWSLVGCHDKTLLSRAQRLYAAVEASDTRPCAAPFTLVACAAAGSSTGGGLAADPWMFPGAEAWPATVAVRRSHGPGCGSVALAMLGRVRQGEASEDVSAAASMVGESAAASRPFGRTNSAAQVLAPHQEFAVDAAAPRRRVPPPELLPVLLARMLESQMPAFSSAGGDLICAAANVDSGAAGCATTGDEDVAAVIPLTSGNRVVGALWIARHCGRGGGSPNSATAAAAGSAAHISNRSQPGVGAGAAAIPTGGSSGSGIGTSSSPHAAAPSSCMASRSCCSLLTSTMALQQLSMSASLLLVGPDAAALGALAGGLAELAGAASVTSLVGALTDALAAHVRERFLLEPRVVAALVPEPSSAAGLLFSITSGGTAAAVPPAGGKAAPAAAVAHGSSAAGGDATPPTAGFSRSPSAQTLPAHGLDPVAVAAGGPTGGYDSPIDALKRGGGAALLAGATTAVVAAASRVAKAAMGGSATRRLASGAAGGDGSSGQHGATPARRAAPNNASSRMLDPMLIYATDTSVRGPGGTAGCEAHVVALSGGDLAALDATAAAAGSGVATLRAKPFSLHDTLLRTLVRRLAADTAFSSAAATPQPQPPPPQHMQAGAQTQAQQQAPGATPTGSAAAAAAAKGRALEVPDCAAHLHDPRLPSRDILMLLTALSAGGSGAAASAANAAAGAPASLGSATGRVLTMAAGSGNGNGETLNKDSASPFSRPLPAPLLAEMSQSLLEILQCASALVAHKVTRELATEMSMLSGATPAGSYAIVHDLRVRATDGAAGSAEAGGGGDGFAHVTMPADMLLGACSTGGGCGGYTTPSGVFASAAAGLRGLTAAMRSTGGGSGGGSFKLGSGAGGLDGVGGLGRLVPLLGCQYPAGASLYDAVPEPATGTSRAGVARGNAIRAGASSGAAAFAAAISAGTPRGGGACRTGSAGVGRFTLAVANADGSAGYGGDAAAGADSGIGGGDVAGCSATGDAAADSCSGLDTFLSLGNTQSGMRITVGSTSNFDTATSLLLGSIGLHGGGGGGGGTGGTARHSMSLIHMEDMDPVKGTMRAQMPLLVASLQTSIGNVRSEAAMTAAAAATTAVISRSNSFNRGGAHIPPQSAAAAMMAGFGASGMHGLSRMSDRQAHLTPAAPQQQQQQQQRAAGMGDLDQLELRKQLGVGGCAVVFQGRLGTLDCAVKLMEMPDVDGEMAKPTPATAAAAESGCASASTARTAAGGKQQAEQAGPGTAGAAAAAAAAQVAAAAAEEKQHAAAAASALTERRALLRNAMELAVMQSISHPTIMQVYNVFMNVTIDRQLAPDGSKHLSLKPAAAMQHGPDAPPICMALVCEWCDRACLATALYNRTFPVTLGRRAPSAQNPRGPRIYDYKGIMMTLLDVAMALRHVHANHLIHRDIKPANILLKTNTLDPRGFTAKLADFGFVTLLNMAGDERSGGEPYVVVEDTCGTFGILMFEMLAGGGRPYPEVEPQHIGHLVRSSGMRPTFGDHVPQPYKQLAQRCWSEDPRQRPRAAELVATISHLLSTIAGSGR
ncbi:hypothetical protein HXX76_006740 [Chlamydomonas incerta]|uniref:Protein kinase domain-containing protein n=1 Tax=Chlamydomonas incerta TaxID=51695 RepID=A0A835W0U7_CHLIN|nr:hypothetical protein HXX76_006740 [Chlamydomonas incerta]|eukprot:KAG2436437.1 hypothetical protein HXX76_006740 [Chlamydomonas incerta]